MIHPDKAVALWYASEDYSFEKHIKKYIKDTWDLSVYQRVLEMPCDEFNAENPVEYADALIEYTNTKHWRKQGKRPVNTGDILTIGLQPPLLFIEQQMTKTFQQICKVFQLENWEKTALARLNTQKMTNYLWRE